jgi:hypothetical protein
MGFGPIYKSDEGTHQGWVSRGLQEVLSGLGRKALPFVCEGHFSNFTILGKISNLGVGVVDRDSNYKCWVSFGPNDQMKATKSTKPDFGQKPPISRTRVWDFSKSINLVQWVVWVLFLGHHRRI